MKACCRAMILTRSKDHLWKDKILNHRVPHTMESSLQVGGRLRYCFVSLRHLFVSCWLIRVVGAPVQIIINNVDGVYIKYSVLILIRAVKS